MPEKLVLFGERAGYASASLTWAVERVCALLVVLLVLDVWLGVFARYVVPLPVTFTEEAARYLMIWTAMLAISCGVSRREHIGVQLLQDRMSPGLRALTLCFIDSLAVGCFAFLLVYGMGFVAGGARSFTMIFGMSKALPFAAVPVSAALACIQLVLVAMRDQATLQQQRTEARV